MSVSPTKQKTKEHSICERRISDLEAEVKKHKELLKGVHVSERSAPVSNEELLIIVENHSKQLNEIKSKLVRVVCDC